MLNILLKRKVVIRIDNGHQFISFAFEKACEKLPVVHKRIPNGSPNIFAHIEAFHSILEEDCLQLHEFKNFTEAYHVVMEFMRYYNEVNLHSSISYRPPSEYNNEIIRKSEKTSKMSA